MLHDVALDLLLYYSHVKQVAFMNNQLWLNVNIRAYAQYNILPTKIECESNGFMKDLFHMQWRNNIKYRRKSGHWTSISLSWNFKKFACNSFFKEIGVILIELCCEDSIVHPNDCIIEKKI